VTNVTYQSRSPGCTTESGTLPLGLLFSSTDAANWTRTPIDLPFALPLSLQPIP
jgi:hypothetical protein